MGVLSILGDIVKPVCDLIDGLHTSGEEKGQMRAAINKIENEFAERVLDYESKVLELQTSVINTEAKGESWLQTSWRPVTMLTFLVLVVFDGFGWLKHPLAPEAWTLLQIGLGGYVVGRSAEKILPSVIDKFTKRGTGD